MGNVKTMLASSYQPLMGAAITSVDRGSIASIFPIVTSQMGSAFARSTMVSIVEEQGRRLHMGLAAIVLQIGVWDLGQLNAGLTTTLNKETHYYKHCVARRRSALDMKRTHNVFSNFVKALNN
jgi:hypothetical protein